MNITTIVFQTLYKLVPDNKLFELQKDSNKEYQPLMGCMVLIPLLSMMIFNSDQIPQNEFTLFAIVGFLYYSLLLYVLHKLSNHFNMLDNFMFSRDTNTSDYSFNQKALFWTGLVVMCLLTPYTFILVGCYWYGNR